METHFPTIAAPDKPYESIPNGTLTSRAKPTSSLNPNSKADSSQATSRNPSTRPPQQTPTALLPGAIPWHHHLTFDLFASILARSIFHPAIVLIFYLCLAAIHKHRSPTAYYTLYWASVLAVIDIAFWIDHRVVYGKPRKVELAREVIVVTGGARGLGRVLVERLVRRGCKVGVLDLVGLEGEEEKELREVGEVCWVGGCDVGDEVAVRSGWERIVKELGTPTILINNAAAPIHGLPLIARPTSTTTTTDATTTNQSATLTPSLAKATLATNLLSAYTTLSLFLPPFTSPTPPNGATILTISSILPHLSPALLSDYTPSKSALSSLHHTLTHELHTHPSPSIRQNIKTILFETGQIDTNLFSRVDVPGYMRFFAPVLDVNEVARRVEREIERGDGGVVRMPVWAGLVGGPVWGALPGGVRGLVRWVVGVDRALG